MTNCSTGIAALGRIASGRGEMRVVGSACGSLHRTRNLVPGGTAAIDLSSACSYAFNSDSFSPDELLHLILREVFRKPICGIRQREDCKRRVELRRLHRSERVKKWLVLAFQSFGVMTESSGSICDFRKGTEVRKGTGTRGIIGRYGKDHERRERYCEASGAHRSRAERLHLLTWLSRGRPAPATALALAALRRSRDICGPLRASRECRPACCPA